MVGLCVYTCKYNSCIVYQKEHIMLNMLTYLQQQRLQQQRLPIFENTDNLTQPRPCQRTKELVDL